MTHEHVPGLDLNNGVRIPQLGYGVFQIPPESTQEAVESALEAGYRHIDTAAGYKNEAAVGAAVAASGIAREDLFITTKLRNGDQGRARAAFEDSREALGLEHVDLYLIHWPVPSQGLYLQAWQDLEQIYADGLARAIGVSNFLPEHLDELTQAADVPPAVNQIELHPTFQQRALADASRRHGMAVEAYSPLGQSQDLTTSTVIDIARRHDATPAQVVLAWHLASGNIAIPKTATPERMRENLAAVSLELAPRDMEQINELDAGSRIGADPATAAFSQY
ncbi:MULTISPECIES: aldo/keto reductase [Arthrobacter]|uniref:Aldo/keto reductase n=1 Tax=Arthrobacter sunyaminii TaxID=2816859 RepID=A0A975S4F2_9MICC|nr:MULTISPECIES: aldo/keto reductase [Arthrobacter]MBO0895850.1 aldo/keto reductase [Arthrobacter sunyaminii]MBO0907523.1 aldo/keto reductase [Arthrobacter sunyaminii]QWQ35098.1 aldo/keto reductase [Arthrobacter sunyaminii]